MKNIRQTFESGMFTLRSAAIILKSSCILAAKNEAYDCYYLPGGAVQHGESSAEAVVRELAEETGCVLDVDRLAFVQERFFGQGYHEVTFFYLLKEEAFSFENGMVTDDSGERLYWLPVEQLSDYHLVPDFLKETLRELPGDTVHIVIKE